MKKTIVTLLLGLLLSVPMAYSAERESLFLNLTSDDAWRAGMALAYANNNLKNGHPVTVFLNVTGVRIAVKQVPSHTMGVPGKSNRELLEQAMKSGAKVIVCPMCLKQAGFTPRDLIDGVVMGGPNVTIPAMYGASLVMSY
jgi:predicted peroxiredoxin